MGRSDELSFDSLDGFEYLPDYRRYPVKVRETDMSELELVQGIERSILPQDLNSWMMHEDMGLEYAVWDRENRVAVFDDHQSALLFWNAAHNEGRIGDDTLLLHIDAHPDLRRPETEVGQPFRYVDEASGYLSVLEWDQFIAPAVDQGVVGEYEIWGLKSEQYRGMNCPPQELRDKVDEYDSFVLDLDMDTFQERPDMSESYPRPEEGVYSESDVYDVVAELIPEAEVTTVAFSPGWMDQFSAKAKWDRIYRRI